MGVSNSLSWSGRDRSLIAAIALGAAFILLACTESLDHTVATDGGPSSDAVVDASAGCNGLHHETDLADCEPHPLSYVYGKFIRSSLESYCAAREAAGQTACPKNRRELLSRMNDLCQEGGSMILSTVYSVDEVDVYEASERVSWYFAADTGALLGVEARLKPSMGCGEANVSAGVTHIELVTRSCKTVREIPYECRDLCYAPSEKCPADILADLPPMPPCGAPPLITHETCGEKEGPNFEDGDFTCGNSSCRKYSSGTCWGSCECHRDGRYKWNSQCTE